MQPIEKQKVQELLKQFVNQDLYIHLETTNGAYATHRDASFFNAGAFIRNAKIRYEIGTIAGDGPFRVGLKMDSGWVYGEGLTHFELDEKGRLLMAGLDHQGRLAIAFELSKTPFE
ncbi:YojF family protein [Caldibacillus lycopersici]|uniref:YojF family protein n=1 Tax=Perspicuibacillus lycopersici TaxID=1325689 RepID=A0AAE3ITV0_9BACI|nr:YojF family protein [Perspicuibacillus lycopersici]MCU9613356.1 YojF family protein [Perspicuibacillus lycopersici]